MYCRSYGTTTLNKSLGRKAKLCYMDTDSLILYVKIDTSNYGKIRTVFSALKLNTYLTDGNNENKKAKDTKTGVIKGKVKCADSDKRIQSIDSIKPNAHGTGIDLAFKKEEIKCNHIKRLYKK